MLEKLLAQDVSLSDREKAVVSASAQAAISAMDADPTFWHEISGAEDIARILSILFAVLQCYVSDAWNEVSVPAAVRLSA